METPDICCVWNHKNDTMDRIIINKSYYFKQLSLRVKKSLTLQKIIANIGWLFWDKILHMSVGLFVGTWIARYLGAEQYGMLNYAMAFVALFGPIAQLGLDNIVVRDIVNYPEKKHEILGTAFVLKIVSGIFTLFTTITVIYFVRSGDMLITWLVGLIAAGFIFQAFNVTALYFQSQVMSKYTVYANNIAFFMISFVKIGMILAKFPLIAFAIAGLFEVGLGTTFLIMFYHRNHYDINLWDFNKNTAKRLLKDSYPLILSGISVMLYMRIDQIMLGKMVGDKSLGIYSAAIQISEVWYFIPVAISNSVFPAIMKNKQKDDNLYYQRFQSLYDIMSLLGISVGVITVFISTPLINFLFGSAYTQSAEVLSIHIWAGIFVCLGVASSNYLMAENLQLISFYRTCIGALINITLNLLFIPKYSCLGAAYATLISYFISVFSIIFFKNTQKQVWMMINSLFFINFLKRRIIFM